MMPKIKSGEGGLFVSELNELKKKLAMSARMLFNSGLVDYSGHISARIPGSDHLLILPHPVSRATVVADDMVVTDFEGKLVEGKYKAPSEVYMHARAYKARSDIQIVATCTIIWSRFSAWSINRFIRLRPTRGLSLAPVRCRFIWTPR